MTTLPVPLCLIIMYPTSCPPIGGGNRWLQFIGPQQTVAIFALKNAITHPFSQIITEC